VRYVWRGSKTLRILDLALRRDEGARGVVVGWGTALKAGRSGFRFPLVSLAYSFWPHYGPGVNSASNRNKYQEEFLGSKEGRCIRLILAPSCADYLEIWKSHPRGTLRACPSLYRFCFAFTFYYKERGKFTLRQFYPQRHLLAHIEQRVERSAKTHRDLQKRLILWYLYYNSKLNNPTRFDLQGIINRELNQSNTS
jgi:hypothetical protein